MCVCILINKRSFVPFMCLKCLVVKLGVQRGFVGEAGFGQSLDDALSSTGR